MLCMTIHSDLVTSHKNFINKIAKDITHYNLIGNPAYTYLIPTSQIYHLFLRHSIICVKI